MLALRRLIRRDAMLAALVVAAALALRVLVPGGFMPSIDHGRVAIAICDGTMHHQDPASPAAGKCAYADLALAMTGGADPIQLAAALAFVLVLARHAALVLPPRVAPRLRPPSRAPPFPA